MWLFIWLSQIVKLFAGLLKNVLIDLYENFTSGRARTKLEILNYSNWIQWMLEPMPGVIEWEAGYTLVTSLS